MNVATAFLCKKPIIGIAMWLLTLCATNQALQDKFVDLGGSGTLVHEVTYAPMDEQYRLVLLLRLNGSPASTEINSWQNALCVESNQPLSITLLIKDAEGKAESRQTFEAVCPLPDYADTRTLLLGTTKIRKGRFSVEFINNTPLSRLKGQKVQMLLMGQSAGYP